MKTLSLQLQPPTIRIISLTCILFAAVNASPSFSADRRDPLTVVKTSANRWEKLEGYAITYRIKHSRYANNWVNHTFWFGPPYKNDSNNRKFRYVQEVKNPGEPHLTEPYIVDKVVSWDGKRGTRFERSYISKTKRMSVSQRFHGTDRHESSRIDPYGFLPTLLAGTNVVTSPLHRVVTSDEDIDRWTYVVVEEGEKLGMPASRLRWHLTQLGESDKWLRQAWISSDGNGLPIEFEFNDPSGEDKDHVANLAIDDTVTLPNGHPVPKTGLYEWTSKGVCLDYEFEYVGWKEIDSEQMQRWYWEPPNGTRTRDLIVSETNLKPYSPEEERLIREYLLSLQAPGGGLLARWGWSVFNTFCIAVIGYAVY